MVIGLFIAGMITSSCIDTLDIEIDSEKNFGMTHFFMMGMNYAEAGEGAFFVEQLSKKDSSFADWLQKIYYTRSWDRHYYIYFCNFEQMIWLACLCVGVFSIFQQKEKEELSVIMLSIIGLTIFELLFEARARYLYTYTSLYILLAATGIQIVIKKYLYLPTLHFML